MQTFLPYADFEQSAASLDNSRLGKQRVETLQILRALELPEYGWANHPAVKMWRGYTPALVLYGLTCARVWRGRGYADSTFGQIAEFAPAMVEATQEELRRHSMLPPWLGEKSLHESHRSKLLTKDPDHYRRQFLSTPLGLDYLWPGQATGLPAPTVPAGKPLWVVRTEAPHICGTFVAEAIVALSGDSGIAVDVTGRELADLQAMIDSGRRRKSKPLLALARFLNDMEIGQDVGVFIQRDEALLIGSIASPYRFQAKAVHGLIHQRAVEWHTVIARSSALPPASLQDVRPVFRVRTR